MRGETHLKRLATVAVALTIAEVAWALVCAVTNVSIAYFYGGLIAATAVFFVPGVTETRTGR